MGSPSRAPASRGACSIGSACPRPPPSGGGPRPADVLERPTTGGIALALDDRDRVGEPLVGRDAGVAQVVQRAKDVVVDTSAGTRTAASRSRSRRPSTSGSTGGVRACSPRRAARASATGAEPPIARSYSSRPSRTLIVVPNEDTVAPFSTSQFQPPSGSCSPKQALDERRHVHAEVRPGRDGVAVDARLHLTGEERVVRPRASRTRDRAR